MPVYTPAGVSRLRHAELTTLNRPWVPDGAFAGVGPHRPPRLLVHRDHSRPRDRLRLAEVEIEYLLARTEPTPSLGDQHRQRGLRPRPAQMLQDDITTRSPLGQLNLRAPRPPRNLPHEHHKHRL
ncbi:hypothetical protein BN12_4060027 [Nostocoides japonicum T1-X7]|uniref:Uncharacterized protein n=1 Tax=Nostocoides japonicum T1-X7 TaxID=1194083 RepID=A0A077M2I4_9MICO|nr:hypothetical protein BN12_4060027 [Tetrasphaera japonica T1-X7]